METGIRDAAQICNKVCHIKRAAELVDVSKDTLLRWLKTGKVTDVGRDYNGWRIFTEADIERIRAFRNRIHPPPTIAPIAALSVAAPSPTFARRSWSVSSSPSSIG